MSATSPVWPRRGNRLRTNGGVAERPAPLTSPPQHLGQGWGAGSRGPPPVTPQSLRMKGLLAVGFSEEGTQLWKVLEKDELLNQHCLFTSMRLCTSRNSPWAGSR